LCIFIHLAQNTCQWRDLVNTAMNLRVLEKSGEFRQFLSVQLAPQEGL